MYAISMACMHSSSNAGIAHAPCRVGAVMGMEARCLDTALHHGKQSTNKQFYSSISIQQTAAASVCRGRQCTASCRRTQSAISYTRLLHVFTSHLGIKDSTGLPAGRSSD